MPLCANLHPANAYWSKITLVGYSGRYAQRNRRKWPDLERPAPAALNIQCTLPAVTPRRLTLRRVCHYRIAELPTQRLIKLQFRDRLCIRTLTRISHQPIEHDFCCQVCRLVKLKLGDYLYCFWSNQLLCIHLHRW